MGMVHGPNMVTDNLVFYVDAGNVQSYPGSGPTWYDLVGTADLTNDGATWNSAGYFHVVGGDNLETQSASLTFSTEITLTTWWQRLGTGLGAPRVLEAFMTGVSSPAYSHTLAVDADASLRAWLDENGTAYDRFVTLDDATTWTDGNWHYMVLTFNNTTAVLYMDGVAVESTSITTTGLDDANGIIVGSISNYSGGFSHSDHAFDGYIASCSLYNRGLTAAEVLQNYNAHKSRYGL